MATLHTFRKIKNLRDRDKKQKQKEYQQQMDVFEEKATRLYELLKEKEAAEHQFEQKVSAKTVPAMSFIAHQQYIERLEKQIAFLQQEVQQARKKMQSSQQILTDAHVEVKKYEKLIEHKVDKQSQWLKHEESKQMDELSMKQFLNFQNR